MVHQSEDQLFKYATKEDGIGLLKLLKESNANIKEIENQEMPIVYIISNYFNKYKKIYAFIVLASIFTTAISVGIGFLQNISKNSNSYPQFVLFMCITSLLMSNIGFSKLLNFIYPVFGYIGILQIVIIFFIN